MVTPDDDDDTPSRKQVSPSQGAHHNEMVLAMDSEPAPLTAARTSEPTTLTTAPTTSPHVCDNKPDASPNQADHDRPSRFELPPAEHPSLSSGSGGYYEYHNGPDGNQTGIGYQFFGSDQRDENQRDYMSEMYEYEDGTPHSHDDEHHDYDQDHEHHDYDHDQASESDHGDDVGEEEDDPG